MKAPISTLTLSKNREFRQGLDAIGRKDMATATEKLRGLAVTAPEILPALLVPLYRLTIQSDEPIPIQLLIADLLTTCGWYTEAIHELEDILEERPDESPAFQLLSKIWSRAPQHIEIEGLFESAIEKGIFDSAILDVLPKMYLGRFDYEKSVALYQKLVDREPTAVHLQSGLANLLIKCQRYDDAIEVFEAVIRLSPLHATDISSRLEDMVRLAPDNIALRKALFKCYCKVCQPDRGVFHLEELLKWHPDRTDEVIDLLQEGLGLFPDTASLTLALARALVQKQSYSEAISYLQAVFVLPDHSYLPIIRNIAESILSIYPAQVYAMQLLADIEMAQSRLREALDYLEKITQFEHGEPHAIIERLVKIAKFSPDHKDRSHYITAKLYIQQRRYDDAISECQLLIGSEWDIPARLLAASASEAQGDISASETTLFSALETAPFNRDIHQQLIHLKARVTEQKISELERSENLDSSDHLNLGIAYLTQGEYYPSLEHLQKIGSGSQEFIQGQLLNSRCFLELGRFDQSLNHLTRLLPQIPDQGHRLANLTRYLTSTNQFHLGDIAKSIETLESIIEFDVTFSNIQKLIKTLKQESMMAYRIKAVSGCFNSKQSLFVVSVKNSDPALQASQVLSFAHPHNNAGVEYMIKHHFKAAEDEFRLALQMDPSLIVVYCNWALLKLMQHQVDEVRELLTSAENINPHFDLLHLSHGLLALYENRFDDAETHLQSAYALRADNYLTLINLGDLYFQKNNLQSAFKFWEEAAALGPIFHLIQRRIGYLHPMNRYWEQWHDEIGVSTSLSKQFQQPDAG